MQYSLKLFTKQKPGRDRYQVLDEAGTYVGLIESSNGRVLRTQMAPGARLIDRSWDDLVRDLMQHGGRTYERPSPASQKLNHQTEVDGIDFYMELALTQSKLSRGEFMALPAEDRRRLRDSAKAGIGLAGPMSGIGHSQKLDSDDLRELETAKAIETAEAYDD